MRGGMEMEGSAWAGQFFAPRTAPWGVTRAGLPMLPDRGGYGTTPEQPYQRAADVQVKPAGVGPMEAGENYDFPQFVAKPALTGRSPYGDPWRQGQLGVCVYHVGVQGLNAMGKVYR